jgi:hypothetical protein
VLVRQVPGAIAQFEKASTVAKLKAARDRKRAATGKCGGRQSHMVARPDMAKLAKNCAGNTRRAASDHCVKYRLP